MQKHAWHSNQLFSQIKYRNGEPNAFNFMQTFKGTYFGI